MGTLSDGINTIGLILDIAGVVLVWRFGLPPRVNRGGASYFMLEETDQDELKREARYDRLSRAGLGLVVVGFAIQLLSNFL
jgi:hypothetical protein